MTTLLSSSAKTDTAISQGYSVAIQYFPPAQQFSFDGRVINSCPGSVPAGCHDPCLVESSGRMGMSNAQNARMWRWQLFTQARELYKETLVREIELHIKKCQRKSLLPAVRLNGGSDIDWLRIFPEIFDLFPQVQFYDYTKWLSGKTIPDNYHLTGSYSGRSEFQPFLNAMIRRGLPIAVVFRGKPFPEQFLGLPVVDGDSHDLTFLHRGQNIIALKAKGKARKDNSGFVVDFDFAHVA